MLLSFPVSLLLVLPEAVAGALDPGNQAKMQKKLVALYFSVFVYVSFFNKEKTNNIKIDDSKSKNFNLQ